MDVREKLVELLERAFESFIDDPYCIPDEREFADHLIAHGVTVQEWISFDEAKPKDGQGVLGITTEGEMEVYQFDANWQGCLCQYGGNVKVFNITHWCELPQPPKGE